jgi:hypothetical protein
MPDEFKIFYSCDFYYLKYPIIWDTDFVVAGAEIFIRTAPPRIKVPCAIIFSGDRENFVRAGG